MTEPQALSGRARGNIPADYDLNVNDMVTAGLTVIARKRDNEAKTEDKTENGDQNYVEA